MNSKLTELQAFSAMVKFLEKFYERTKSDDIGTLLSDFQLIGDKQTADPAAWLEWIECINETLQEDKR